MQINSLNRNKKFSFCIVISAIFLLLFFLPVSVRAEDESINLLRQMGKAFSSIAEKASPAVVGIRAQRVVTQQSRYYEFYSDELYEFLFPRQRQQPEGRERTQTVQGSGFIISSDGYILTNNHMVEYAREIEVELTNGQIYQAQVTGTDPDSDVAVIKIDAEGLSFLELANSDALEVGEWVIAIGNPLTFSHTVTAGIVSAKNRGDLGLSDIENYIQTDAAINLGNSGGPLLNLDGEVVGINTAILGATGNIGIGFAIPINIAKYAYEQIREAGSVERGALGIYPQDLDAFIAEGFGLKDIRGVVIPRVVEGSPAEKAGLTVEDVILEVNGEPVESAADLITRISMFKPGMEVELTIWRDGKRQTVEVVLGSRSELAQADGGTVQGPGQPSGTSQAMGLTVQNLTDELAQRYGYEGLMGVVVVEVEPGSSAARNGIPVGTLISTVNTQPVRNVREFNEAIEEARQEERERVVLHINYQGNYSYISLSLN